MLEDVQKKQFRKMDEEIGKEGLAVVQMGGSLSLTSM